MEKATKPNSLNLVISTFTPARTGQVENNEHARSNPPPHNQGDNQRKDNGQHSRNGARRPPYRPITGRHRSEGDRMRQGRAVPQRAARGTLSHSRAQQEPLPLIKGPLAHLSKLRGAHPEGRSRDLLS